VPQEPDVAEDDPVDLRAPLAVLARRWKLAVAVIAFAVLASLGLSLTQATRYRATAEVLLRSPPAVLPGAAGSPAGSRDETPRQLAAEVRRFESATVQQAVARVYEGPLDPKDVRAAVVSGRSGLLRATLTAGHAEDAATLLNRYTTTFLQVRGRQQADALRSQRAEVQAELDDLTARLAQLRAPLTAVEQQLAAHPGSKALAAQRNALVQSLSPTLTPLDSQRALYQSQLEELARRTAIGGSDGSRVVAPARAPQHAISPTPVRDGSLALLVGAALGVALAFLVDALDQRIRRSADLERIAGGLPVLAVVPEVRRVHDDEFVAARDDTRGPAAEAYRTLWTALQTIAADRPHRVIQVTSPESGEGKTTAAANLAVTIAQGGERVAVVCCDLRRPTLQQRMRVHLQPGLTDVLAGDVPLAAAVQRTSSNVQVVTAGAPPPNSAELLSSEQAAAVVGALADDVDVVILDCTPVLPVSDALLVARLADATVVVTDARSTERKAVRRTLQLLHQVGAPVVGLVLNGVPEGGDHGDGDGDRHARDLTAAAI
jgi:capsular exopolysaccharide synthesis family protein